MFNRITNWLKIEDIASDDLRKAGEDISKSGGVILSNTKAEITKIPIEIKELIFYNMQLIEEAIELEKNGGK